MKAFNRFTYVLIMIIIPGCYISESIKTRDEFDKKASNGNISIFTKDSTKYFLYDPILIDSIIRGTGRMEKTNISREFKGDIRLADVLYIQSDNVSFWGTAAAIAAIGFLGITSKAILDDNRDGIHAKVVYPNSGGGGGSCPFVYSKSGSEYILEGEAIPLALGKKLETETTNFLAHLTPGNNEICLRISNLRPETHYINSIRLLKYYCEPGYKLLADENNFVWAAADERSPIYAEDVNKHNILPEIIEADGHYLRSDLSTASFNKGFTDKLFITFPKDKLQDSSILIIKAINTRISDILFRKIYNFLGDEVLDFINEAENNPSVLSSLQNWIKEVSLKAYVWSGNKWEYKGSILPEATCVPFERCIYLNLAEIHTDDLLVKLEFMTDVWNIDRAAISYICTKLLKSEEIPLISAEFSGSEIERIISTRDGMYQILLPGDNIELKYYDKEPGQDAGYYLNVSGYLYEWYVKDPTADISFLPFIGQGNSRMKLFRTILNSKDLLLPPVYDEWEKVRQ